MTFVLKRLILGVLLIVAASSALLISDLGRRTATAHSAPSALIHGKFVRLDGAAKFGNLLYLMVTRLTAGSAAVVSANNVQMRREV